MTDEQRLQMITEQLILVRDNLFRGMSKSIQKLQARSINELLELPSHTQSPPAQQEPVAKVCHDLDGHIGWNPNLRQLPDEGTALYTSPPAHRTWVGLTDEEIDQGLLRSDYAFKTAEAWRAGVVFAMTKLKAKNSL